MDVVELVAVAHRRLQLRRILVAIERDPRLLEEGLMVLKIKKPMELAGLSARLTRATRQEADIAEIGKRYDVVLDKIDEIKGAHAEHASELEQYENALRSKIESMVGSNGGDPLSDGQDGQQSGELGQVINGVKAS